MHNEEILRLLAEDIRRIFEKTQLETKDVQEIRLRAGAPLMVVGNGRELFLDRVGRAWSSAIQGYRVSAREVTKTLEKVSSYSLYAYEAEMRSGFLTVQGGHRIGVCGRTIVENGHIVGIRDISFLNIRIAHQIRDCALQFLPYIYEGTRLKHTLIMSPPGCGKTTVLRDLVRLISDGNGFAKGQSVGIVDERSEIAGCSQGVPQNDVGLRTDVLDGCPKTEGLLMLVRSMSPAVLAVDEIAGEADKRALLTAAASGCRVLATAHGEVYEDIYRRKDLRSLWEDGLFERCLLLEHHGMPGVLKAVFDHKKGCIYRRENTGCLYV